MNVLKSLTNWLIRLKDEHPFFVLCIGMMSFPIIVLVGFIWFVLYFSIALFHDLTILLFQLPYETWLDDGQGGIF